MNKLQVVELGTAGLEPSVIGYGTYHLLDKLDPYTAIQSLGVAFEAGINFFDTSDNYGTELAIGKAVSEGVLRRDEIVIATKTGLATSASEAIEWGKAKSQDTHPGRIREQVEKSLWLLGDDVGRIDLFQLHVYDPTVGALDVAITMSELIDEDKIVEYGVSNYPLDALVELRQAAASNGLAQPACIQPFHNALSSFGNQDIIDFARAEGMTVLAHSPLHKGALTDHGVDMLDELIDQVTKENSETTDQTLLELLRDGTDDLKKLKEYAASCDISLATLCMGWLVMQEETIVLTSCTTSEYVTDAVAANKVNIGSQGLELIEQIRKKPSTRAFANQLLRIMKSTKIYYR
jgi:aryl-alcohol dehydrogenase-like predicted oxidoreductase